MRLAYLRMRMAWALFSVFLMGVIFATVMIYIIDLVLGLLLYENLFALIWWFPLPLVGWAVPLPLDLPWALIVGAFMLLFQWITGPWAVRQAVQLHYLSPSEAGWLYQEVEELSRKAGVPTPKLALVNSSVPNAFVFGRTAGGTTLAVHKGLIDHLNRREIRAVLGHEIGHIRHRDLIVMTLASAIPLIALMVLRGALWSSRAVAWTGGRSRSKGDGTAALAILLAALAIAALAAIIFGASLLVVRGLSRMREHYADAFSAQLTGDPRGLMSALTKITWGLSLASEAPSSGLRSFYIGDPKQAAAETEYIRTHRYEFDLDKDGVLDERELMIAMETEARRHKLAGLHAALSTHPPTYKRILLLKQLEKELAARQAMTVNRQGELSLDAI